MRLVAALIAMSALLGPTSLWATEFPEAGTHIHWPELIDQGKGRVAPIERGILFVPANRSSPDSGAIALSYWRLKRLGGPKPEQPPIFMLDGGPGFQGYDRNSASWYLDYTEKFREIADVVWVGQRGIGAAYPSTDCPPPKNTTNTWLDPKFGPAVAEASKTCKSLWQSEGVDIHGLTVQEAAADVEELRKALGYDQVMLWGESFGTHWSIAVLRRFPASVARVVLNSIEGPDHTYDDPAGQLRALERIAADAERSPVYADQVPEGGFLEAMKATIRGAEQSPILAEHEGREIRIDSDMLRSLAFGYLDPPRGVRSEAVWPAGILRWRRGDFAATVEALDRPNQFGDFWRSASYFQFDCGSGVSPARLERLKNDPALRYLEDPNIIYHHACPEWPADSGPAFRGQFKTSVPALLVHGDWDLATPWENALEIKDQFENGTLVRVRRGGHGAIWDAMEHDPNFADSVMAFLKGQTNIEIGDVTLPPPDWQL
ncbi:MAG: alpha/beta fold hydrolase [Pseudomonadota bacterium]